MEDPAVAASREAIVATWREVSAAWRPRSQQPLGLVLLGCAAAIFLGGPAIARLVGVPSATWLRTGMLALAALSAVAGLFAMQLRVVPYVPAELIASAIASLLDPTTPIARQRRAAVELIFHATDTDGPTMRAGFDPIVVARQLGDAMRELHTVEQVLVDGLGIARVFSKP